MLILASASPRRREFLQLLGVAFTVSATHVDETLPFPCDAATHALTIARRKAAKAVEENPGSWVLAADTVVAVDGLLMGKPADAAEAKRMLALLSGREHEVVTAVALARTGELLDRVVSTRVTFLPLAERQIDWYVATGEPFDKAGGYGLQGRAAAFISTIAGSHTNVIGLPLAETCELLDRADLAPWGG